MLNSSLGLVALIIFIIAYFFVVTEELTQLRKSKPLLLAAGIMWLLVAIAAKSSGLLPQVQAAFKHNFLEFAELFFFLVVAMTYINTLEERQVFNALKGWLIKRQLSYKALFWVTGWLAFFLSPIADNMTTALVMCAIVMAVGVNQPRFISLACINIVVAANAGGTFCPFGDITTLMVWQKGVIAFAGFFKIFLPAVVNFLIPALCMHFALPNEKPMPVKENIVIAKGGLTVVFLFLLTILTTVVLYHYYTLPPVTGMMLGLAYLKLFGYYLKTKKENMNGTLNLDESGTFDIFRKFHRIEWDTLLFFYGVILCVGALAAFGYLQLASETMYQTWGNHFSAFHQQTPGNVAIGLLSAIIDNIPLMFAVLTVNPAMSEGQWLLVTLTAGVGGSLLSIGSAAGVALMGQAKKHYTFLSHLKWSWAILLGYIGSILTHFWVNHHLF